MTSAPAVTIDVVQADLGRPDHQSAVVDLVDAYARDPMGQGAPLAEDIRRALIPGLRQHPTTLIFLAYQGAEPIGIAVCFLGFSTFAARPLINIHDITVKPALRGRGIGRQLLAAVERKARELGCCKLTLEVQENNHRAKRTYHAAGFERMQYLEAAGGALYFAKPL
jgi:ribosomal protein S18 acetylase RimI-like enzyme